MSATEIKTTTVWDSADSVAFGPDCRMRVVKSETPNGGGFRYECKQCPSRGRWTDNFRQALRRGKRHAWNVCEGRHR